MSEWALPVRIFGYNIFFNFVPPALMSPHISEEAMAFQISLLFAAQTSDIFGDF